MSTESSKSPDVSIDADPGTDIELVESNVHTKVAMVTIGGRSYPYKMVSHCHVCQSPHRTYIEKQILLGFSIASVMRDLEGMETGHLPHPERKSLRNNMDNHVPSPMVAQQKMMETRARAVGKSIEESAESLVDEYVTAKTIVQMGHERIVNGEVKPEISDVLAAAKLILQIESTTDGGLDQDMWVSALSAYFELTTDFIPPEQLQAWRRRMDTHPVLKAIREKREREEEIVVEVGDIA